ncbi:MAG: VWA domain-containing protein [archaeon]
MVDITFKDPIYLWFLGAIVILIALHFVTLKHTKRRALKFANFEAIERVTGSEILSKNILLLYIRLIIIFLIIFAVAGTTIWYTGKATNTDFVLAIDASSSMQAQDILPNRLEAAKEAAIFFVDSAYARTKIGIISFSGSAFIETELTEDMLKVRQAISGITTRYVGGTDILDAVVTGTDLLFKGKNMKSIILLSDGQINVASVEDVVDYAKKNGVIIHTIGIGTEQGGKIGDVGPSGETISKIDTDSLKAIAYSTGGSFHLVSKQQELVNAYLEVLQSSTARLSINTAPAMIILALLLLIIEWVLVNTKYRTLP